MEPRAEAELVARFQRDPQGPAGHEAFAAIVAALQDPIYAQIRRSVFDRDRAQELLQETFLKAFQALPRYQRRAPLRAWIGRIARNLCIDEGRRRRTRPQQGPRTESGTGLVEQAPGDTLGADELASEEEERAQVRSALESLPPIYREIVHLRVYEGLSHKAIAELLDCSVSAAKQRMHKALRLLDQELRKVADP